MTNKYRKAMDELQTDDLFKRTIIRHALESPPIDQAPVRIIRRKTVGLTAVALILLLAILIPLGVRDSGTPHSANLFSGFTVMAYAADGTPITVKPEIEFPLGRYSMLMSSAPGFPVKIAAEGADRIEIHSSAGQLLFWNPSDGRVQGQGNRAEMESGGTFYWSPLEEKESSIAAAGSTLEITAYDQQTEIGRATIEIKAEEQDRYTATWLDEEQR